MQFTTPDPDLEFTAEKNFKKLIKLFEQTKERLTRCEEVNVILNLQKEK